MQFEINKQSTSININIKIDGEIATNVDVIEGYVRNRTRANVSTSRLLCYSLCFFFTMIVTIGVVSFIIIERNRTTTMKTVVSSTLVRTTEDDPTMSTMLTTTRTSIASTTIISSMTTITTTPSTSTTFYDGIWNPISQKGLLYISDFNNGKKEQ